MEYPSLECTPYGAPPAASNGSTDMTKTQVVIASAETIFRRGFRQYIQPHLGFCEEAQDTEQAIDLINSKKPSIAVLDTNLNATEIMKNTTDRSAANFLVMHHKRDNEGNFWSARRHFQGGAMGFIGKHESPETFLAAIRGIKKGEIWVEEGIRKRLLVALLVQGADEPQRDGPPEKLLTDRELEVFTLIGKGMITKQIAARLNLSHKTIESHKDHIKQKLHLRNPSELMIAAVEFSIRGTRELTLAIQ